MDTIYHRLRLLTTPQGLLGMLGCALLGFALIKLFAALMLSNFSSQPDSLLSFFHDFYKDRYDAQALAWVTSTIGFYWKYSGAQLRKMDRLMGIDQHRY